jgi:hypothetical protein
MSVPSMNSKLLGIYLNDHLAGSTLGAELAKRSAGSNKGSSYGAFLRKVAKEIADDRDSLKAVMKRLEVGEDIPKKLTGWTAEKLGRLKPNGQLTGYSPLSRVVELEGLALGITGKLGLWKALHALASEEPRLDAAELDRLRERAESQRDGVERHRVRAAADAFGG